MRKILNEQLDITDAHPLKARFYDYKNFTYPWHFHSEFEVIYIEKGYGLGMAGDGMTDFSDQQLFLLGSNLPHYLENAPEYDLKEELRVNGVIIQFEKDINTNKDLWNRYNIPKHENEPDHVLVGKNFLIAEDNGINSDMLKELLKEEGAACDCAKNGMIIRAQQTTAHRVVLHGLFLLPARTMIWPLISLSQPGMEAQNSMIRF